MSTQEKMELVLCLMVTRYQIMLIALWISWFSPQFHHAKDDETISLLQEAYRVSRKYVYVLECYQAWSNYASPSKFYASAFCPFPWTKGVASAFPHDWFQDLLEHSCFHDPDVVQNFWALMRTANVSESHIRVLARNWICKYRNFLMNNIFFLSV